MSRAQLCMLTRHEAAPVWFWIGGLHCWTRWGQGSSHANLLSWPGWHGLRDIFIVFPNSLADNSEVITEQGHTHKSASSVASCLLLKASLRLNLGLVPALLCFSLRQHSRITCRITFNEDWVRDDSSTIKSTIYVIPRKVIYMKMSILYSIVT